MVQWRTLPARPARTTPLPEDLHPALVKALLTQGIVTLYTHQAQAWHAARKGENLVVASGTASGKTLCYNLPVLDGLLRDPEARALYLFPTKALAQDQLEGIHELTSALREQLPENADLPQMVEHSLLTAGIYDGDTPAHARPSIRANARIILSNPDMLHAGILPHHTAWAMFFQNLHFVVLDELHVYRGVFGSHVANVIRRLKRIAQNYGATPQFILTSATIANPVELAEWLVEAPVSLVDEDGSARGPRHFMVYNPPVVDTALGIRRGVLPECVRLVVDLRAYGIQTIVFGQSRRMVELLLKGIREQEPNNPESSNPVRGYRSGYLPAQRREIEQGLRDGTVRVAVATNALELGIDIGGMGAALLAGYPGTIASSRQQMGRAGRGSDPSLAVLITSAYPLDQFLARHPEYFFDRSPERALINPNNLLILLSHVRCAAFELPFGPGDSFGKADPQQLLSLLDFLQVQGVLHQSKDRYFWMAEQYPAQAVSLRSASPDRLILRSEETTIGEVDIPSAIWMVHPGAVYLHEGEVYRVDALNLEENTAHLTPTELAYYTTPARESTVQLTEKRAEATVRGATKAHGEITVTTQVVGYRMVKWGTGEHLGGEVLDLPPTILQTTGYWVALADDTVGKLKDEGLWSNAPNDYGPGWLALARQVRARDGFRCQMCGTPEQARAHHVHHKTPFRAFASAEQANQLANLVTLCPTCHRRAETAVRVRSGLAGLGFVLGNLAPLFLMCDARDLGVHSDPQSPLAEGIPAVTLYDQVPAGIGFSERLYEIHDELLRRARELVAACECADGCPSCVGPGGEGGYGGKKETLAILEALTG